MRWTVFGWSGSGMDCRTALGTAVDSRTRLTSGNCMAFAEAGGADTGLACLGTQRGAASRSRASTIGSGR